jgi:hypothetical protein
MRQFGKVEIPQEAFIAALKMDARTREPTPTGGMAAGLR